MPPEQTIHDAVVKVCPEVKKEECCQCGILANKEDLIEHRSYVSKNSGVYFSGDFCEECFVLMEVSMEAVNQWEKRHKINEGKSLHGIDEIPGFEGTMESLNKLTVR